MTLSPYKTLKKYMYCAWSFHYIFSFVFQVSLWKESLEGQWVCISDVNKGQGQINEQRPSSG